MRDQVNINQQPVFVTAAGSLGTGRGNDAERFTVVATDPESAGNVTFELQSGTIPPGLSLTNEGSEGGTAVISGTATDPAANTTYNFVLRAVDAASNVSSRAFSITIERDITFQSFTADGTFAVPSGTSVLSELLVVAGGGGSQGIHSPEPVHGPGTGGGGAGGLVYFPCYPVTPGGTITVSVGCGGRVGPQAAAPNVAGEDSVFGSPGDPGLGQGGVITAKGGGRGGYAYGNPNSGTDGQPGGSGGGGGYSPSNNSGGTAIQPTQPGNSGAYGFGNAGGTGAGYNTNKGGGGGAGAVGQPGAQGGNGGIGKAYTIADGTTPVYYAGGGGGSAQGCGGQGGGAIHSNATYSAPGSGGGHPGTPATIFGQTGQGGVNKGGGAGGVDNSGNGWPSQYNVGNNGGKGIVIVAY